MKRLEDKLRNLVLDSMENDDLSDEEKKEETSFTFDSFKRSKKRRELADALCGYHGHVHTMATQVNEGQEKMK